MHESKFSKWYSWASRKGIPDTRCPGVYCHAVSALSLDGKPFSWIDEIVYVGMTNAKAGIAGRLRQFDATISGKHLLHGGADRVRFKYANYDDLAAQLYVAAAPFPCKVRAATPDDLEVMGKVARFEYQCLAEYMRRFACLPAFNDKDNAPKHSKL